MGRTSYVATAMRTTARPARAREGRAAPAGRRRDRSRGQSVAEFALLLPVMLAFIGLTLDFSRAFQAWLTLESATRDAAEAAATNALDTNNALTWAQKTVCLQAQNVPGFQRSSAPSPNDLNQCVAPSVSVTAFDRSATAVGASTRFPIGTATIRSTIQFQPLFAYPFITQNGAWTISSQATFSVAQGRT